MLQLCDFTHCAPAIRHIHVFQPRRRDSGALQQLAILDGRIRYPISEKRIRVLCKMTLQMVK
jgi:hypothetical protein